MIKFHGLNKLSLVDYPEHMSAILFTGHCNFRCPFCHNSSLVLDPESQGVLDNEEILSEYSLLFFWFTIIITTTATSTPAIKYRTNIIIVV